MNGIFSDYYIRKTKRKGMLIKRIFPFEKGLLLYLG